MITKEEAFDIARQKFPGSSGLGFAAIYAEGYYDALTPAETPEPAPLRCFFCACTEEDNRRNGWGPLTDIRVIVAEGEEGYGNILRLVCNDHLITTTVGLAELGFADHRHGGINFLEDPKCPGAARYGDCPTPEVED